MTDPFGPKLPQCILLPVVSGLGLTLFIFFHILFGYVLWSNHEMFP
jgi:hypothetical protein